LGYHGSLGVIDEPGFVSFSLVLDLSNWFRNIYPERLDYVDQVFSFAQEVSTKHANSPDLHSQQAQTNVLSLLLCPIKAYSSLFTALALPHFIPFLHAQPYPTRRAVGGEVIRTILRNQIMIETQPNLNAALDVIKVIIKEGAQSSGQYSGPIHRKAAETEETLEEQGWLARLVHLIQSDVNGIQFAVSLESLSVYILTALASTICPKGVLRRQ
jgi:vacuolar protein sorting-associated protein 35